MAGSGVARASTRGVALLVVLIAALLGALGNPAPAIAADSDDIAALVNQERWSRGLPGLLRNGDLDRVALAWAQQLGASGTLSHNPHTPNQIPPGWRSWGENVGQGYGSGAAMHQAWMDSEGHRENVLGDFTDLGVAFLAAGGTWWGVEVFARYPGHVGPGAPAAAAPAPAPAPPPAPPPPAAPAPSEAPAAATPSPTPTATPTPTPTPSARPSAPPRSSPSPTPAAVPPAPSRGDPDAVPAGAVAALGGAGLLLLVVPAALLVPASRRRVAALFGRRARRH